MPPKPKKWFGTLRRFRHRLTAKLFGRSDTFTRALKHFLRTQQQDGIWSRIGVQEHSTHFGPRSRITDLFERRDQVYLALEAQRLQWHTPPPLIYHDLLDAAARVGRIEERVGYTFKDKMLCIEALKLTSSVIPFYFKGVVHQVDKNNRLALLGDRVLGLALCEVWFQTGNTTADYAKMALGSESRAVLFTRGHALDIHKNLLLNQWPYSQPTDNQVAETVEAILGAVYLDSGRSIEAVKEVITQAALDTHKLLKADAHSQDSQEQKELASLRIMERVEQDHRARIAASRPRRPLNAAAPGRKLVAEQVKRQVQEGSTTTEGQAQNESSETAQTQTRSKANTALTHAEKSKSLADILIRHKARRKEKAQLKTDKHKSQVLNEEAPSENCDQALGSKAQRRAFAAANKLSKEGDLLDDASAQDGTTADSGRQPSPVSHVKDQDKVDTSHKPDNQDPQTSLPTEEKTSEADDQLQHNNAASTTTTRDTLLASQQELPVEEIAGLDRRYARIRRLWWREAVKTGAMLKKKGINVDTWVLYEQKKLSRLREVPADGPDAPNMTVGEQSSTKEEDSLGVPNSTVGKHLPTKEADGSNAPNDTVEEHRCTKEADDLSASNKEVGEHPSTKDASSLSNDERVTQKKLRRKARREEKRRYEKGLAEMQSQKDSVALTKPSEETTEAPASLLPEPPTTTGTKANPIQENMVPPSITIEQERSPAIGSDEADTATSTIPAPTQELSGSSKNSDPTSPSLCSPESDTAISPAPVQKLSSSPEEPDPTKSSWAASKNRNKPTRELSRHSEETDFVRASAIDWDDEKETVVRTKDVEQLERDIFNSHRTTWQANGTAFSTRKPSERPHKHVAIARRSLRNSLIFAEQLTRRAPTNRTTTREEDAGLKNWMQKDPRQADTNARPFVRFDFHEPDTKRFMANITKDESGAPDTPRSESKKKYTLYTPSIRRLPGRSRSLVKLGEWPPSEYRR